MSHSIKFRLRCLLVLLLCACALQAQTRARWERVDNCSLKRENRNGITYVHFFNSRDGVVAGDAGLIRYTRNGGVTWRLTPPPRNGPPLTGEDIITGAESGQDLYVVTLQRLLRSSDKGENWETMPSPLLPGALADEHGPNLRVEYYDVTFLSEQKGWLLCGVWKKVGNREPTFLQSYALYTENGGSTWRRQRLPTAALMVQMCFVNERRGWVVGEDGTILHTDDGDFWGQQNYPVDQVGGARPKLFDVDFRGNNRGIIVGEKGAVLYTTDGGRNWDRAQSPVLLRQRDIVRVQILDETHAWAVGNAGGIFYTDSGGELWERYDSPATDDLYSIFMLDRKRGWITGDRNTLLMYDADERD